MGRDWGPGWGGCRAWEGTDAEAAGEGGEEERWGRLQKAVEEAPLRYTRNLEQVAVKPPLRSRSCG